MKALMLPTLLEDVAADHDPRGDLQLELTDAVPWPWRAELTSAEAHELLLEAQARGLVQAQLAQGDGSLAWVASHQPGESSSGVASALSCKTT